MKLKILKFPFFNKKIIRTFKKKCGRFLAYFIGLTIAVTFLFRFLPIPFSAYMAEQKIAHIIKLDFGYKVNYTWTSIENISPYMQLAVIAAEDQNFPNHGGFDWNAIKSAIKHNERSSRTRGASTISQQTAKNMFLWHGQSWVRKGIEVPTTFMIENLWSKKRILEVYLNIAEFGNGIFGVEAASRHYFKKPAKRLTQSEAALLAAVLPNPIIYKVNRPSLLVRKKQAWIIRQMNSLGLNYLKKL